MTRALRWIVGQTVSLIGLLFLLIATPFVILGKAIVDERDR